MKVPDRMKVYIGRRVYKAGEELPANYSLRTMELTKEPKKKEAPKKDA